MALRNIRKDDEPCLSKKCRTVDKFGPVLGELIDDMFDTMYDADGVGLAAPQVGILRRICVIDTGEENERVELVNPVILSSDGIQGGMEGCLSFPGQSGYVERAEHVVVAAQDRNGEPHAYEGHGLFARAIQHELDHLDGLTYLRLVKEPPEEYLRAHAEEEEE